MAARGLRAQYNHSPHLNRALRYRTGRNGAAFGFPAMLGEILSVAQVAGSTLLKLIPISIALGVVFAVLTHLSACNPGRVDLS